MVPYTVSPGPNGDVRIDIAGKQYPPPEISAMILQKIKADAEAKRPRSAGMPDGCSIAMALLPASPAFLPSNCCSPWACWPCPSWHSGCSGWTGRSSDNTQRTSKATPLQISRMPMPRRKVSWPIVVCTLPPR